MRILTPAAHPPIKVPAAPRAGFAVAPKRRARAPTRRNVAKATVARSSL